MKPTLDEDVQATLERLEQKDRGLKQFLKKAYGYAVFPSVGKAALVVGGSYGHGEVFERGKRIGFATLAQTTIGVQVGGDTYSEVIAFESKETLDRFKKGRLAFAANASAVLVKAGAAGTADYEKGVSVFVYSEGGMLLELAIGGQKFKFRPLSEGPPDQQDKGKGAAGRGREQEGKEENQEDEEDEGDEQGGSDSGRGMIEGLRRAASGVGDYVREHPVAASIVGAGLAAGVALMVISRLRGSSDQGSEDDAADDENDDDQSDTQAQDQSDEQDDEGQDSGEEEDDEGGQSRNNKGFGRLLSRGR